MRKFWFPLFLFIILIIPSVSSAAIQDNVGMLFAKEPPTLEERYGFEKRNVSPPLVSPSLALPRKHAIVEKIIPTLKPQTKPILPQQVKLSASPKEIPPKVLGEDSKEKSPKAAQTPKTEVKAPLPLKKKVPETSIVVSGVIATPKVETSDNKDITQKSPNPLSKPIDKDKHGGFNNIGNTIEAIPKEVNKTEETFPTEIYDKKSYDDVLAIIKKSDSIFAQGLGIKDSEAEIRDYIYKNEFQPYVTLENVTEVFPPNMRYDAYVSQTEKAITLSEAVEALSDASRGKTYKYAYVDVFLTSKYFENYSLKVVKTTPSGNFYEWINNWLNTPSLIFIEMDTSLQLPDEFLLEYMEKSPPTYMRGVTNMSNTPYFRFIKNLQLNSTYTPTDLYAVNTFCKSYFAKTLVYKRFNDRKILVSQEEPTFLEGACNINGEDIIYDSIISKKVILNQGEMREYITYLKKSRLLVSKTIADKLIFLSNNYPDLYQGYLIDHDIAIGKIIEANAVLDRALEIEI